MLTNWATGRLWIKMMQLYDYLIDLPNNILSIERAFLHMPIDFC